MSQQNGVVYTKQWVVDLMLQSINALNSRVLANKTITEPSCGDGAFIHRIIEIIAASGNYNNPDDYSHLHAYDIDPQAITNTRRNICNLLTQYTTMSTEQAEQTAEHIAKQTDYISAVSKNSIPQADIIIGNPPYIRATDMPRATRTHYMEQTSTMSYGTDIYVGFIEQGLRNLKQDGILAYICADRWMQNKYGTTLRKLINTQYDLTNIIQMHGVDAFQDEVDAYPAITIIKNRSPQPTFTYTRCLPEFTAEDSYELNKGTQHGATWTQSILRKPELPEDNITLTDSKTKQTIDSIASTFPTIEQAGINIGIGIATGRDAVFITEDPTIVEPDRLTPLFYMRDWRRGKRDRQKWLINPWAKNGQLIDLHDYPLTQEYFEAHREELSSRHIAKKNKHAWYRTIDKIKPGLQNTPKLLLPDLAPNCEPVFEDGHKYPHHNCYWITSNTWDLQALGGLLISNMTNETIKSLGVKMRGGTLRFQAQYLRKLHVPTAESLTKQQEQNLIEAFNKNDRDLATKTTNQIYGIEA